MNQRLRARRRHDQRRVADAIVLDGGFPQRSIGGGIGKPRPRRDGNTVDRVRKGVDPGRQVEPAVWRMAKFPLRPMDVAAVNDLI